MTIKLIAINHKDPLPKTEVLAISADKSDYGYREKIIGFLKKADNGKIICESSTGSEVLYNVQHYVNIHEIIP